MKGMNAGVVIREKRNEFGTRCYVSLTTHEAVPAKVPLKLVKNAQYIS